MSGLPSSLLLSGGLPDWIPFTEEDVTFRGDLDGIMDTFVWEGPQITATWSRNVSRTWWSRYHMLTGPKIEEICSYRYVFGLATRDWTVSYHLRSW